MKYSVFPFPAIVGQEGLKTALILSCINPRIGGVLIRGEKGTAKSTAVRALAALLPDTRLVTLPLNATEDRVAGGIDFSLAVKSGQRRIMPGLLAEAHQGILYVDEVNLLDDHIVDIILDACASGQHRVEREGICHTHPAEFMLVGTMNPEEGELRPQFLDRFGLCTDIVSEKDPDLRIKLLEQRDAYDDDPENFCAQFQDEADDLCARITAARDRVSQVMFSENLRQYTAEICTENYVAGHRADLVIEQAVLARCAYLGKMNASREDVEEIAELALVHRRRQTAPPEPPPPPPPPEDNNTDDSSNENETSEEETESQPLPEENEHDHEHQGPPPEIGEGEDAQNESDENGSNESESQEPEEGDPEESDHDGSPDHDGVVDQIFDVGETFKVKPFTSTKDKVFRRGSGRRSRSRTNTRQGRYVKSCLPRDSHDIAFDATLRAAAPYQKSRLNGFNGNGDQDAALSIILKDTDIREKIREKRMGNFLLFCVDASGSMGARGRMSASKGAIMSLLLDAYQKRDKVAMVTFRKDGAFVNLPETASVELAARLLEEMPVGGKTPLTAGLVQSFEILTRHLNRVPDARPIVIIITDGRANVAFGNREKPLKKH